MRALIFLSAILFSHLALSEEERPKLKELIRKYYPSYNDKIYQKYGIENFNPYFNGRQFMIDNYGSMITIPTFTETINQNITVPGEMVSVWKQVGGVETVKNGYYIANLKGHVGVTAVNNLAINALDPNRPLVNGPVNSIDGPTLNYHDKFNEFLAVNEAAGEYSYESWNKTISDMNNYLQATYPEAVNEVFAKLDACTVDNCRVLFDSTILQDGRRQDRYITGLETFQGEGTSYNLEVITYEGDYEQQKDKIETISKVEVMRKAAEWKVSFSPVFFFDISNQKSILNLEESTPKDFADSSVSEREGEESKPRTDFNSLIKSGSKGAYQVTKTTDSLVGIGTAATLNYINAGLVSAVTGYASLAPMVGGKKTTTRMMKNPKGKFKHLKIPKKAKEIEDWGIGDKLEWDIKGGVNFSAGVAAFGLSAGVVYTGVGTWKKSIHKLSKEIIKAEIKKGHLQSFGANTGAGIVNLSTSAFYQKFKGFSYIFDLSVPEGAQGFELFRKGKIHEVDELARALHQELSFRDFEDREFDDEESDEGSDLLEMPIIRLEDVERMTKGRSLAFGSGVPFVSFSLGKSRFFSRELKEFHLDNTFTDLKTVAVMKQKTGRFFNFNTNRIYGFFATDYVIRDHSHGEKSTGKLVLDGYEAKFVWQLHRSKAKPKRLKKELRKLISKTGFKKFFTIEIPKIDKLGSISLDFTFKFPKGTVDYFMDLVEKGQKFRRLRIAMEGMIQSYFKDIKKTKDPNGFCKTNLYNFCKRKHLRRGKKAIKRMEEALKNMKRNVAIEPKKFLKHLVKFGNASLKTPFAFQALSLLAGPFGAQGEIDIKGTNFKRYKSKIKFKRSKKIE